MAKNSGTVSAEQLTSYLARIERLDEEIGNIRNDIKDILTEAKMAGFDIAIIRQILKLKKMDEDDRREQDELLDTYRSALNI
ncbi:MAG: DUF2312 domain-containing protein [Rickettsiales bacterium]|jgi:uncharacterized protein (UPF0335 family)|nr:DUF2312 domain-containing protein [Rickettsiales bacterium]